MYIVPYDSEAQLEVYLVWGKRWGSEGGMWGKKNSMQGLARTGTDIFVNIREHLHCRYYNHWNSTRFYRDLLAPEMAENYAFIGTLALRTES